MRFSTAIKQLHNISDFLKEYANQGRTRGYYASTADALVEINTVVNEISDTISDLVGEQDIFGSDFVDSTVCENQDVPAEEKPKVSDDTANQRLCALESAVSQIQLMLMSMQNNTDRNNPSAPEPAVSQADKSEVVDTAQTVEPKSKEKSSRCLGVMKSYESALREMADKHSDYQNVNVLSRLLLDWYVARFVQNKQYNCKFRYPVKRIKKLIYSITIAYGYHMEQGDIDKFVAEFYSWIKQLGYDQKITDQYATPYEVYDIEQKNNGRYANLTALILYDLLWDHGLCNACCDVKFKSEYVMPTGLSMQMVSMGYDVSAEYVDYHQDHSILMRLGI